MTQEEKAKAYDEAIEIAKKELNACGSQDCDAAKQIFRLFPELKESEDERIRKELLNYLYDVHDDDEERARWIAYLEKQGEQRPVIVPKFMVGDFIKLKDSDETYEVSKIEIFDTDEIYYHLTNGGCVCESADNFELVKQKPTDKVEPKFKVGDIIKDTEDGEVFTIRTITKDKYIYTDDSFDWIKDQDEYELVEQKPTDEEMKELLHTEYEKGRADAIEEMQNPAWSEEDCNQIESIACHLDNIGNGAMAELLLNIMYKYKSHRPQSYWKPSDEQIKALEYYIYGHSPTATITKGTVWGNAIVGLLEQLKKLREEQL